MVTEISKTQMSEYLNHVNNGSTRKSWVEGTTDVALSLLAGFSVTEAMTDPLKLRTLTEISLKKLFTESKVNKLLNEYFESASHPEPVKAGWQNSRWLNEYVDHNTNPYHIDKWDPNASQYDNKPFPTEFQKQLPEQITTQMSKYRALQAAQPKPISVTLGGRTLLMTAVAIGTYHALQSNQDELTELALSNLETKKLCANWMDANNFMRIVDGLKNAHHHHNDPSIITRLRNEAHNEWQKIAQQHGNTENGLTKPTAIDTIIDEAIESPRQVLRTLSPELDAVRNAPAVEYEKGSKIDQYITLVNDYYIEQIHNAPLPLKEPLATHWSEIKQLHYGLADAGDSLKAIEQSAKQLAARIERGGHEPYELPVSVPLKRESIDAPSLTY